VEDFLISDPNKEILESPDPNKEILESHYFNNPKFHFQLYTYNGPPHFQESLIQSSEFEDIEQKLLAYYTKESDIVLDLGANIGTTSILISKIVKNPLNQLVAVEPNLEVCKVLEKNMVYNNANFTVVKGILSKGKKKKYLQGDGWNAYIVDTKTDKEVNCFDFDELNKKFNFNVLSVDIEGSFFSLFKEYPQMFETETLRLVIFEQDPLGADYSLISDALEKSNFDLVFQHPNRRKHSVFIRN